VSHVLPSTGDEATAAAMTSLTTAIVYALIGHGREAEASSFLTMLRNSNESMIGEGPLLRKLRTAVDVQEILLKACAEQKA
jgi:hypothetical protein